jgi:hypothetical protein
MLHPRRMDISIVGSEQKPVGMTTLVISVLDYARVMSWFDGTNIQILRPLQ